jgi:DNA end-binding protein Ku
MLRPWDAAQLSVASRRLTAFARKVSGHEVFRKPGQFLTTPATFRDRYEEALLAHLKAKQAGVPERKPMFAAPQRVVNLMEALRRSVAADTKSAAPRKEAPAVPARKRA